MHTDIPTYVQVVVDTLLGCASEKSEHKGSCLGNFRTHFYTIFKNRRYTSDDTAVLCFMYYDVQDFSWETKVVFASKEDAEGLLGILKNVNLRVFRIQQVQKFCKYWIEVSFSDLRGAPMEVHLSLTPKRKDELWSEQLQIC